MTRSLALPLVLALATVCASGCRPPENRVADHLDRFSSILTSHRRDVPGGVRATRSYMRQHLAGALGAVAEVEIELDKLTGDAREIRMRQAMAVLAPADRRFEIAHSLFGQKSASAAQRDEMIGAIEPLLRLFHPVAGLYESLDKRVTGKSDTKE